MLQLFFRPNYVWFPVHLKGPMIPDPSGHLAELIVYITSTRVDLYSHQIPLAFSVYAILQNALNMPKVIVLILSHVFITNQDVNRENLAMLVIWGAIAPILTSL